MAEKLAAENGRISNYKGLLTLTLEMFILHIIVHHSHQPLPTCQKSLKSKKHFVDGRTYGRTYGRIHRQTFETGFIRLKS